jgi:hypothetical protein
MSNTYDTLTVFQGMNMSGYALQDITVMIDTILHPNAGDLEILLLHQGVTDTLIYQTGVFRDNFFGTALNDSAITPVSGGNAPFNRPVQAGTTAFTIQ